MSMDEILKMISEFGILIVIAAVFIWNSVTHNKTTESILQDLQMAMTLQVGILENLKHTCENQSTALNIIQNTLSANTQSLERHDKRAEFMNNDVREILTILRTRPCVTQNETREVA